ncbi:peptidase T [uncultured Gemella sp.]|uniref:peptidase T n=1 Tax=uncultured Gemella sp. TaxID=254352 RepID=UPI00263315AB|nr:peptidase T [uncultured Gemella sp.]
MKYETMLERFLGYVKFKSRSDAASTTIPSTPEQKDFLRMLKGQLEELNLSDIELNEENWFLTATLPANTDKPYDKIGFISHVDTADFNVEGINPQVIENYDGEDIVLNKELNVVMSKAEFPNLSNYKGLTLITTDGTTLLGADDKAGITEIVEAIKYLSEHPEIEHGDIRIAFGPDEEIGRGADHFDAKGFATDYAFTMDGGVLGELEYESFNAAQAKFKIKGVSVHPGTAKGKMINASLIASEIIEMFPKDEVPEKTEGYEGFYFLDEMKSNCEEGEVVYIIRDHDKAKFLAKKEFVKELVEKINKKYGREVVKLELKDEYYNMGEIIKDHMYVVDIAKQAMENLGIKPIIKPIRGGTDGSKISFMGLPTPNIFAGGENFHGKYEFVALESMEKATDVIVKIVKLNAER